MNTLYVFLLLVRVTMGVISPIPSMFPMHCDVTSDYGIEYGAAFWWDLIYTQDGLWMLELDTAYNVTLACDGWEAVYIELAGGYPWVVLEPAISLLEPQEGWR